MAKKIVAAGLVAYRIRDGRREVLLVHPGGPFFKNKDLGCWSIPKGIINEGEDILAAAKREFFEETGFDPAAQLVSLGSAERPEKIIHVWAFGGDFDVSKLVSNTCEVEWPPKTAKKMTIPEVDRAEYFSVEQARQKVYAYQVPILDAFEKIA